MKFADNEHRKFFEDMVQKSGTSGDNYRMALFYVLGLLPDTRRWINDIYDFKEKTPKHSALKKPWQTSGNIKVTQTLSADIESAKKEGRLPDTRTEPML